MILSFSYGESGPTLLWDAVLEASDIAVVHGWPIDKSITGWVGTIVFRGGYQMIVWSTRAEWERLFSAMTGASR